MGPLRRYRVVLNGMATTMQLTEKDAERLGATLADGPAVAPQPVEPAPPAGEPGTKARRPANKARTVADKSDG